MDMKRTTFKKENLDSYKKALTNVLNVIAFLKPELNYCQGMSFIGAFLIQLTASEEETFYFGRYLLSINYGLGLYYF